MARFTEAPYGIRYDTRSTRFALLNTSPQNGRAAAWREFAALLGLTYLLHYPLLRLPYFWDEAGYYIPSTRDLFLGGGLIPHSVPSNAHPPLVMLYLAGCWQALGDSVFVTRSVLVVISAFALLGVLRLGRRVANREVAWAAAVCTALYPVFFAQSSLAHVDLAAAAFTLWGLDAFLGGNAWGTAAFFVLAVLSKETALLAPMALLVWSIVCPALPEKLKPVACRENLKTAMRWALIAPALALAAWYGYHYARTGYVFGNPEFFRYNVQATASPLRIVLAFGMRIWQAFGYMHLFVLTLLMAWAMTRPPLQDADKERPRIAIPTQCVFGAVIVAYIAAMAVIGGAVLARYMLPVVPLVILIAVATLWRRSRYWIAWVGLTCAAFVAGWFVNPPYGFAPEDNLAYRDYVQLHQHAAAYLATHAPRQRILTAWPASDELTRPYLGYVGQRFSVVRIEDFSIEQVMSAAEARSEFDVALAFSTKYEPQHPLLQRWEWWKSVKQRYFGFHKDVPPELAAEILGGHVVFRETRVGQWAAIIQIERMEDAGVEKLTGHQVARVGLHDQPDIASGH